jgi:hypothetical protein
MQANAEASQACLLFKPRSFQTLIHFCSSVASDSTSENEDRLRMLTDALLAKQVALEHLNAEKSALVLQLEKVCPFARSRFPSVA